MLRWMSSWSKLKGAFGVARSEGGLLLLLSMRLCAAAMRHIILNSLPSLLPIPS